VSNPQGKAGKEGDVSVAVFVEWPGFTAEQYNLLRDLVGWEREVAQESIIHIAASAPKVSA
jgi:hypothetical protein